LKDSITKRLDGTPNEAFRIRIAAVGIAVVGLLFILRLFILMVVQHSFYTNLASGTHEVYSKLFPERGEVFVQDSRTKEEYPLAMNRDYFLVYANTKEILDDETAKFVTEVLAQTFQYDDAKKLEVYTRLNKRDDPYEPLEPKVDENVMNILLEQELAGIHGVRVPFRFYPEYRLASQVIGFLGKNEKGENVGHYGIEGYWDKELAGQGGFVEGAKNAVGGLIAIANLSKKPAEDGPDILLTLDRTIQSRACDILKQGVIEYGAKSGSLIIMDPYTGSIRAMCSAPDFDPNDYGNVEDAEAYNNSNIFVAYEPGSIFKPLVMAAAINEGLVSPNSGFFDSGVSEGVCDTPIKNAGDKSYGQTDMTGVLVDSINTGMVHVGKLLGKEKLVKYMEKYGLHVRTGIELDTEADGNIESLYKSSKFDCYSATATFGQGVMVTPLQMTTAFAAIANGGKLMKPQIVEELRYEDGRVERFKARETAQVLDGKTASLVSAMLVNVVERGHATKAKIPGYYIAGKTGTAQIAENGRYIQDMNHSFIGFAPVENPKFIMFVKLEKPQRAYAESTSVPIFGDIAKFLLQYYRIPPER